MLARSQESTTLAPTTANATVAAGEMQVAIDHHQAGRLDDAERVYRQVIAAEPRHSDALHLLGVVALQRGNRTQAVELIAKAVAIDPANVAALGNLGMAYHALNRADEAESALRNALALKPDWDAAHSNLGVVLQAKGDLDGAEASFQAALQFNPNHADALNNLGGIFKDSGQLEQAEACYRKALAVNPRSVETCINLGSVYQRRNILDQAEACYRQALQLRPDHAGACNGIGSVMQQQGKLADAEEWLRKALAISPEMAEAASNLGDVLQALGHLDEAEEWCHTALAIRPGYAEALNNLGTVCKRRGRLDEAEADYRRALSFDPGHAAAYSNLGTVACERGQLNEAETCFRKALALNPQSAVSKYNLAILLLLGGNYREGLALYESRFETFTRAFSASRGSYEQLKQHPRWTGEALSGKRILVWTEQGLGDSLMVMRYLPMLRERAAGHVIVYCEPALERLMQSMPGVDRVVAETDGLPFGMFDVHCPIMSLPFLFDTLPDSIPDRIPYLFVPDLLRAQWQERLSGMAKTRVGLVWAGSTTLRDDARRSIALRQFAPLLQLDGVQPISLQKGGAAAQLEDWPGDVANWMDACGDFLDTAALVQNLDLVISVDTAVAHLAGALGKPVWLLNRFESEWRWGSVRDDSPWYPTMRIFRQTERNGWDSVIARVAAELGKGVRFT